MTDTTPSMSTPVHWHASARARRDEYSTELEALIAHQSSLRQVALWAASAGHELVDCIDQDEFNRDLIIRHDGHRVYLVYDCS